jgi:aminoglycoside 3-N-acetyltransferase
MGAIPIAVLRRPERVRGNHPIDSFSAVGPLAKEIIATQTPLDVYGPLRAIGELGGSVLLMGVGLDRMTLLHTAEQESGRELFHRCALDADGQPVECLIGGCSEGFSRFEAHIGHLARETTVGASRWRAFPVDATLAAAAEAIRTKPDITHCATRPAAPAPMPSSAAQSSPRTANHLPEATAAQCLPSEYD